MKNSLYVITGLLILIWGIIFWGFNSLGAVLLLLVVAGLIVIVRLLFNRQLTNK